MGDCKILAYRGSVEEAAAGAVTALSGETCHASTAQPAGEGAKPSGRARCSLPRPLKLPVLCEQVFAPAASPALARAARGEEAHLPKGQAVLLNSSSCVSS